MSHKSPEGSWNTPRDPESKDSPLDIPANPAESHEVGSGNSEARTREDDLARAQKILESLPTETPPAVVRQVPSSPKTERSTTFTDRLKSFYTFFVKAWRLFGRKRLPPMDDYVRKHISESPMMEELRLETQRLSSRRMRSEESEATFLQLLIRIAKVNDVLEVGTFTGYGTLAMAEALPEKGTVTTCDISEDWAAIGKKYWQRAGVDGKIDLRIGQATQTMEELLKSKGPASFDLIFIDANKDGYDAYYELALQLVRQGGIIAIDNTLWGGLVADEWVNDKDTSALRKLNKKISLDSRVTTTLIPSWDGLTLVQKK